MKLVISRNQISENPDQFFQRAGFARIFDNRRGQESFVRRLGNYHYPRLHVYINEAGERITFDMHLDQKQASYSGSHMHNADYDGPVVETEINRLRELVAEAAVPLAAIQPDKVLEKINGRDQQRDQVYNDNESQSFVNEDDHRPWWKRILGV